MNNAIHHPFLHVRPPVHPPYETFGRVLASFLVATPVPTVAAPPAFHLREALRLRETGWVHRAHAGVGARTGLHDARLPVACFLTVDFSWKLVKVYKALFFEPSQGTGFLGSGRGNVHLGPLWGHCPDGKHHLQVLEGWLPCGLWGKLFNFSRLWTSNTCLPAPSQGSQIGFLTVFLPGFTRPRTVLLRGWSQNCFTFAVPTAPVSGIL